VQSVAAANSGSGNEAVAENDKLGVRVSNLDPMTAKKDDLTPHEGAVVKSVEPDSLAADAGLKVGDVITKVDKMDITSAQKFADAMKAAKISDGVKLVVRGDDGMDRMVYVQKN